MPTARPRHSITETDDIARALDDAAARWPAEAGSRGRLLLQLVREGHRAIAGEQELEVVRRRDAVRRTRGALTGAYDEDELARLHDEWPA